MPWMRGFSLADTKRSPRSRHTSESEAYTAKDRQSPQHAISGHRRNRSAGGHLEIKNPSPPVVRPVSLSQSSAPPPGRWRVKNPSARAQLWVRGTSKNPALTRGPCILGAMSQDVRVSAARAIPGARHSAPAATGVSPRSGSVPRVSSGRSPRTSEPMTPPVSAGAIVLGECVIVCDSV